MFKVVINPFSPSAIKYWYSIQKKKKVSFSVPLKTNKWAKCCSYFSFKAMFFLWFVSGRDDAWASRHSCGAGRDWSDWGDLYGLPLVSWRNYIQVLGGVCPLLPPHSEAIFVSAMTSASGHHPQQILILHFLVFFLLSEVTDIVCLSTTATLSPTRWLSSWLAEPYRRTSQTSHQRSSQRECKTLSVSTTALQSTLFLSQAKLGWYIQIILLVRGVSLLL